MGKLLHKLYIALVKVIATLMPGSSHMLFAGQGSSAQLCRHMQRSGARRVLIVTDKPLVELGIVAQATHALDHSITGQVTFADVLPDPSFEIVEAGAALYHAEQCDAILAIGGGSSIDAAKVIGVTVSCEGNVRDYVGLGKIKNPIPPLFAIPTTSGTGSEATAGAVITDSATHEKNTIIGPELIPLAACIDPALLTGLPPAITAATGIDALTHAIESYIGTWDRGNSRQLAANATRLIFQHLESAVRDGKDLADRDALAHAAYQAGQAINQVHVGNVHAIAHQLGALYGTPHGLANALVLPHVLQLSLNAARKPLAELAELIGQHSAEDFIQAIRDLNGNIGVPTALDSLRREDFPAIIRRARKEAFAYPTPHFMSEADVQTVLEKILP